MMKKSIKKIGLLGLAALFLGGGCLIYSSHMANAAQGGNASSGNLKGCSSGGLSCTNEGVVNRVVDYDTYMGMKNEIGLTQTEKDKIAKASEGMNNPVVFQFTFGAFDPVTGAYLGYERGQLRPEIADRNNTVYMDPSTVQGGITLAMYQFFFELAVAHGVPMEYDYLKTGSFVFDLDWLPEGMTLDVFAAMQEIAKKTNPSTGNKRATFQSKTIIDVGDAIPEGPQDSGWDGFVSLEFSSDEPVTVTFTHTMQYSGFSLSGSDVMTSEASAGTDANDMNTADADDPINNSTPYSITTGGGGNFGVFSTSAATSDFSGGTQTVSLSPGETTTVCSNISYQRKVATMVSLKHIQRKYNAVKDSWDTVGTDHSDWYNIGYSGSGGSGACATIHRPADPTGNPVNPNNGGSTTPDIMFAGETTQVAWDLHGNTHDTRRLMERQITAHLVDALPSNASRFFVGYNRSSSDPYGYYSGANIAARHNFGDEGANLDNNPDTYSKAFGVVVPDYTGYKYCHTGGYRYESWYAINGSWKHDTRTDKPYRNYWYVYDASCRTIAKKPSVAIWNGSMLTAGGVTTSTSPRFDNANLGSFGIKSTAGGSRTLYGSWVEYLAAIGRNVNYFTSGSSLAIGSKTLAPPRSNPLDTSNSSLTIANKNRLGSSGITNNSTYRTRLTTFLENQATRPGGDTLGAMENVTTTQILRYDGNLKITGNITTQPGNYTNIYNIPQVVIFVHGNVEIASNVTRLDAWLIVDGKINTCSDFASGATEADAIGRPRDTCNKQLAFNGPVMANKLELNRSFGSDPLITYRNGTFGAPSTKYAAGEIFNLRMDTYLWAYAQAGRYASSYTESYTRELAPRY